eukprot:SAG31_NODE_1225_length_9271_cov_10.376472_6_plen_43_part_00
MTGWAARPNAMTPGKNMLVRTTMTSVALVERWMLAQRRRLAW